MFHWKGKNINLSTVAVRTVSPEFFCYSLVVEVADELSYLPLHLLRYVLGDDAQ